MCIIGNRKSKANGDFKERSIQMKRFLSMIKAACVAVSAVCVPAAAYAKNNITVSLDGENIPFDQPPAIINGRTLVPMRAIFEAMGAEVEWEADTQTILSTKDDTVISMTINNRTMERAGQKIRLDVPPQIVGNRTMVPARAVAESFGCDVKWNGRARKVSIFTEKTDESWKQAYIDYILSSPDTNDAAYFTLLDVNGDAVPELYIDSDFYAGGSVLCTYADGQVKEQRLSQTGLTCMEGENIFGNSGGKMGDYYDDYYCILYGEIIPLYHGEYHEAYFYGNTEIYRYYWNGTEVTEGEYKANKARLIDPARAFRPGNQVKYDNGSYKGIGICDTLNEIFDAIEKY